MIALLSKDLRMKQRKKTMEFPTRVTDIHGELIRWQALITSVTPNSDPRRASY